MIQSLEELKTIENGFWDFLTFTIDSEPNDPKCGNESQKKVDLENDVILNQISNKRDVSAKWISGKNPLKMLFCFKNCFDSCRVLLWVQNDFGPSKSFWSSTNHFGRVQFILVGSKSFWTGPNYKNYSIKVQFEPDQNDLDPTKTYNFNFHWRWRWWDRIQAIFLNLFYFMIDQFHKFFSQFLQFGPTVAGSSHHVGV